MNCWKKDNETGAEEHRSFHSGCLECGSRAEKMIICKVGAAQAGLLYLIRWAISLCHKGNLETRL